VGKCRPCSQSGPHKYGRQVDRNISIYHTNQLILIEVFYYFLNCDTNTRVGLKKGHSPLCIMKTYCQSDTYYCRWQSPSTSVISASLGSIHTHLPKQNSPPKELNSRWKLFLLRETFLSVNMSWPSAKMQNILSVTKLPVKIYKAQFSYSRYAISKQRHFNLGRNIKFQSLWLVSSWRLKQHAPLKY
jgi:hypothetical protein